MPSVLDETDKEHSAESNIRADIGPAGSHDDLGVSNEERQAETDAPDSLYRSEDSPSDIENTESGGAKGDSSTKSDESELEKLDKSLYNSQDGGGLFSRIRGANKRRKIIAVATGSGVAGLVIGGFFMLPLKVLHISENLQSTFFSSSEDAAEDVSNRLLSSYLIYKVIPGLNGSCPSTKVDKSCAVVNDDDNYVTQLFRAWKDNNLEGKMAEKHGIEIKRENGRYRVLQNGTELFSESINSRNTDTDGFNQRMNSRLNRSDVRRAMLNAIENETFYKRIMYRYKYGSLMERKYGIVRCVIACEYRNDRADRSELRKMKYKAWVLQRVVGPLNQGYSLAFQCAVANFDCVSEADATVDEDGAKKTKFENDLRAATKTAIGDGRMTKEKLAQLQANADDIKNNGLANHLLKEVFGEGGGKIAGGAVAGIGIVEAIASLVEGISAAGTGVQVMNYSLKSGAAVQTYSMYRTTADEIKPGTLNFEELGYASQSLGDSFGTDQGGGGAESAPYYNDIMGSQGIDTASLSLFPKAAAAAPYQCDDKSYITSGLCPEMAVGTATTGANAIKELGAFFDKIGLSAIAGAWGKTGGLLFDGISFLIGKSGLTDALGALTPGIIKEKAADIGKELGKWFTEKLFINFMTENPSGGRMFESAALGANIAGNDYAHYGLGAGKISDQAANDIRYARAIEKRQEFSKQPFFARMLDTSSSYSMVSRVALASPSGSSAATSLASTLLSPVKMLSSSIPSLDKTDAAPKRNLDLAGVTQYGYTGNEDIFKTSDFEKYWTDNNCDDEEQVKAWGESSKLNGTNGSFENDKPYPCKLLGSAVSMNGAYYSDEFLSPEELGNTSNSVNGNGGKARVATFNVFFDGNTQKSVNVIKDGTGLDVVGLQEVRKPKLIDMMSGGMLGGEYESYPTPAGYDKAGYGAQNPIIWKKSTMELVEGSAKSIPGYSINGGKKPDANIEVKLRIKSTGQEFYVINHHDPVGDSAAAIQERYNSATERAAYVKKLSDAPAIITGDFNSKYGTLKNHEKNQPPLGNKVENLGYCILTADETGLWDAFDASKTLSGKCPSANKNNRPGIVDHIYLSREIAVNNYDNSIEPPVNGSDVHPTVIADLTFPGNTTGVSEELITATYNIQAEGLGGSPNKAGKAADLMKEEGVSVFGAQEVRTSQFKAITAKGWAGKLTSPDGRAVFWDASKFKLKDSGEWLITKDGSRKPMIWVKLDSGGEKPLYVFSMHTDPKSANNAVRQQSARETLTEINKVIRDDSIPFLVMGDMNSNYTNSREVYDILKQELDLAYFKTENRIGAGCDTIQEKDPRKQDCGHRPPANHIDHIYVSKTAKMAVQSWKNIADQNTLRISDHNPVVVKLTVPSIASKNASPETTGWSWPLKKSINNGPCYGGPSGHAGMDMNSNSIENIVYAMHSGKIVRKGFDKAAGNYITILANEQFNGKPVYYSYEHLRSNSIKVNVGDQVKGGQGVAIMGRTGNVQLTSSLTHLHIVTATTNTLGSYGNLGTTFDPMKILGKAGAAPEGYKCT